jgi:hypothetical protein
VAVLVVPVMSAMLTSWPGAYRSMHDPYDVPFASALA